MGERKDFEMSKVATVMALACLAGCGDCNREVRDVPYTGDATAIDPYVEAAGLHWDPGGCDSTGCTYFLYGTAWLHNPREEAFQTAVRCEFWDDNYLIGDSTMADIDIGARRSKELEFREQYTTPDTSSISFTCELE